jgi:NADH dehydrogenase
MMSESSEKPGATPIRPPRVVVLGGGYGGVYTALKLQKAAKRGAIELSIISRNNYFLSQPMLAEVVSGSIEPPHIVNPIRRLLPQASFHQAEIESVETDTRNVVINYHGDNTHFDRIPYDHLVIAVGSGTDLSNLPGMAEHAFPFKTMGDAFFLRNHLISILEQAEVESDPGLKSELLTFLVAGGGYTGVEVAAEINSFMREAAKSYRHIEQHEIKVILLHRGNRILPVLDKKLAAFSHSVLERRGLKVRLGTSIRGATAQSAILDDGTVIQTRTLVAAIGSAPNRFLDKTPVERDKRGRVVVEETLIVPGHPGLWAVGDCAAVPNRPGDGTCPPTAQYALRQARHLARNILAELKGNALRPFSYKSLGVFVPLGRFSAAAEILGFRLSGFLAWWLYRTYYLIQLPRLERKLRVVTDWTLELAFHRDIVQMDTSRSHGISRAHYEPGALIYREGDLARNFYTILSGRVQVVRQQAGGESPVATLEAGEYFGEMSLLQGLRHSASVRALIPTDVLIMSGPDFKALAGSSTYFGETLAEVMRRRLSNSEVPPEPREGREGSLRPTISRNQRES